MFFFNINKRKTTSSKNTNINEKWGDIVRIYMFLTVFSTLNQSSMDVFAPATKCFRQSFDNKCELYIKFWWEGTIMIRTWNLFLKSYLECKGEGSERPNFTCPVFRFAIPIIAIRQINGPVFRIPLEYQNF